VMCWRRRCTIKPSGGTRRKYDFHQPITILAISTTAIRNLTKPPRILLLLTAPSSARKLLPRKLVVSKSLPSRDHDLTAYIGLRDRMCLSPFVRPVYFFHGGDPRVSLGFPDAGRQGAEAPHLYGGRLPSSATLPKALDCFLRVP